MFTRKISLSPRFKTQLFTAAVGFGASFTLGRAFTACDLKETPHVHVHMDAGKAVVDSVSSDATDDVSSPKDTSGASNDASAPETKTDAAKQD